MNTFTDERTLYDLLKVRERVTNPEALSHLDAVIEILKRDLEITEDVTLT